MSWWNASEENLQDRKDQTNVELVSKVQRQGTNFGPSEQAAQKVEMSVTRTNTRKDGNITRFGSRYFVQGQRGELTAFPPPRLARPHLRRAKSI